MMYDANGVICTAVHTACIDVYSPAEIKAISACKVAATQVFQRVTDFSTAGTEESSHLVGLPPPVDGGLYDKRLGTLDGREFCGTCGCRSDCPGHLGYIQLSLPVFQPVFLPSLVKLLKLACLHCGRLRVSQAAACLFVKMFQLLQLQRFHELEQLLEIATATSRSKFAHADCNLGLLTSTQKLFIAQILRLIEQKKDGEALTHGVACDVDLQRAPKACDTQTEKSSREGGSTADTELGRELCREEVSGLQQRIYSEAHCVDVQASEPTDLLDVDVKEKCLLDNRRETKLFSEDGVGNDALLLRRLAATHTVDLHFASKLGEDISGSSLQIVTWRRLRRSLLARIAATSVCPNCGRSNRSTFHVAARSASIEMRWRWTGEPPFDSSSFVLSMLGKTCSAAQSQNLPNACQVPLRKQLFDEHCLTFGKSGQAVGKLQLYAFQVFPLVQQVFNRTADALLLQYIFPLAARSKGSYFFITSLPVSANIFRPPATGSGFQQSKGFVGAGRGMPVLHPRTTSFLDLLRINEKVLYAFNILKHPDPLAAVEDPSQLPDLFVGQAINSSVCSSEKISSTLSLEERRKLKEFVMMHAGGSAAWLPSYATQLQQKVNEISDQTKAENPSTAAPGIRQWLEKKAGTIRQKMMGKRVNYAARTVLAPDGLLGTNEIGVPVHFAMKLSIPERVTPHNAHVLAAMVINGAHKHPGAVALKDEAGNLFNLEYISESGRRAKANELIAASQHSISGGSFLSSSTTGTVDASYIVYRHMLDGDVVLMNRQPSLHRLSLMGHFVRISRGVCYSYHVNDYLKRNNLLESAILRSLTEVGERKLLKTKNECAEEEKKKNFMPSSLVHYRGLFRIRKSCGSRNTREDGGGHHCREEGCTEQTFVEEDVFRLNFVNCSSYNADFDGDEMNMHLPQDIMARTEAAYIVNADCHFLVPKNGEPMRGLIQDFCLAGCLLTARDTFLKVDEFQNLVYSGVSCYIDSKVDNVILDRGAHFDQHYLAAGHALIGDPYKRMLLRGSRPEDSGATTLHIEPPAILWPTRLWTGKQVITCLLKTLVDAMAARRIKQTQASAKTDSSKSMFAFCSQTSLAKLFKGINLTSNSKTPGNAWGGVEDADTEEEQVIIRESELLQGVFDKAQFGSCAGGLLHCIYLLLGSAAAGLLLQALAALFCAFLKLRGATTSPGDFLMRREGELHRRALVEKIIMAGTYLQEHFTARVSCLMGLKTESSACVTATPRRDGHYEETVKEQLSESASTSLVASSANRTLVELPDSIQPLKQRMLLLCLGAAHLPRKEFDMEKSVDNIQNFGVSRSTELKLERIRLSRVAASLIRSLRRQCGESRSTISSQKEEPEKIQKFESETDTKTSNVCKTNHCSAVQIDEWKSTSIETELQVDGWTVSRFQRQPSIVGGLDSAKTNAAAEQIKLASLLLSDVYGRGGQSCRVLLSKLLNYYLCRKDLQQRTCAPVLNFSNGSAGECMKETKISICIPFLDTGEREGSCETCNSSAPAPNTMVCLPNKGYIQGDASLLQAKRYHPSWLWRDAEGDAPIVALTQVFENSERYLLESSGNCPISAARDGVKTFLMPSRLTARRVRNLYTANSKHRKGKLNELLDSFFQSALGKVASKFTDVMKGSAFLYRFPQNGFASMIKSGSKGNNVNYSMISIFLGQQSLEGQRVKSMPSDKTLPAFLPFDFGSRAKGFIASSFLSGLKEEEYYFHCMAGREGLVDTAVKTAKSGYLQRSLVKGLETLTVGYDGSVRDSDHSVIQFVYGDDGRDPAHRLTFKKMRPLLENVNLLKGLIHIPHQLLKHRAIIKSLKKSEDSVAENSVDGIVKTAVGALAAEEGLAPESESPLHNLGATCFQFEKNIKQIISNTIQEYQGPCDSSKSPADQHKEDDTGTGHCGEAKQLQRNGGFRYFASEKHKQRAYTSEEDLQLENVLRLLYYRCCMQPGEAVGCVAAQSIGEPATQMTLNTFHLAGHGATNVTMGIPRLRELLQQGARTKTPVLRIPIRTVPNLYEGESVTADVSVSAPRILARNAATALQAFTTINLADCVHSVGIDTEVCYQRPTTASTELCGSGSLSWRYDVYIQLENLSHFAQVVRTFSRAEICVLILKKVVRTFLKKVCRLMVATVGHHSRSDFSEARNDLQELYQNVICQENTANRWSHRSKMKEVLRSASGVVNITGEKRSDADESVAELCANSNKKNVAKDTMEEEKENEEEAEADSNSDEEGSRSDENLDADDRKDAVGNEEVLDTEFEASAENVEETDSVEAERLGRGARRLKKTKEDSTKSDIFNGQTGWIEGEEEDSETDFESRGSVISGEGTSSDEDGHEENESTNLFTSVDPAEDSQSSGQCRAGRDAEINANSCAPLLLPFADLLNGKQWNLRTHLFEHKEEGAETSRSESAVLDVALDSHALWENGRHLRGVLLISREVASILKSIIVCPRTWRIAVTFGWPVEWCPYRLELLTMLTNLLKYCRIQHPPGLAAPRVVQGEGSNPLFMELQCEGSNIGWIHQMKEEAIDHNAIMTNDAQAVLKHYGVEAARVCVTKELDTVFSAYGIKVDYRHLALIADYMTHDGVIRPFNRLGMASSNSPFLQMSYETSFKFLTEACERAANDALTTPTGSLIVGSPPAVGPYHCQIYTQLSETFET